MLASYDDEAHWHLSMCPDQWDIEEMGPRVWSATTYLRHREGKHSHVEIRNGQDALGKHGQGSV